MKNINFEYYKVFYYVARYGSFTQAAQALYSNQPNVARVINLLEQELGCQLMIRTNRGIHLTEEGKKLYKRIWVAYEQIRLGEEELSERETGQGVVVLGASEMALHLYLMEQMQVSKEECLYIGDSEVDAATGKNAGLKTIGVLWGFRDRKTLETAGADHLIERPEELLQFV